MSLSGLPAELLRRILQLRTLLHRQMALPHWRMAWQEFINVVNRQYCFKWEWVGSGLEVTADYEAKHGEWNLVNCRDLDNPFVDYVQDGFSEFFCEMTILSTMHNSGETANFPGMQYYYTLRLTQDNRDWLVRFMDRKQGMNKCRADKEIDKSGIR